MKLRYLVVFVPAMIIVWFCSAIIYVYQNAYIGMKLAKTADPYSQNARLGKSIALFGDSSMYGTGIADKNMTLAGLIGQGCPDCSVTNYATNGAKINKLGQQIKASTNTNHQLAIVSIGYNDVLHFYVDLHDSCNSIKYGIDMLKDTADELIIYTMPNAATSRFYPFPLNYHFGNRSKTLNQCIRDAAKLSEDKNIRVIDLEPMYDRKLMRAHESRDRLHVNESGAAFWYKFIEEDVINLNQKTKTSS